jgi:hypothetical protein
MGTRAVGDGQGPIAREQKEKLRGQALSACTFSIISAEYCERRMGV